MRENRTIKLMAAGLTVIGFLALGFAFVPGLASSFFAVPIMVIAVFLAIALFVNIIAPDGKKSVVEKQKRTLEGMDMYSLIDRLVDDLDEDEMNYLRRRLEAHEHEPDQKLTQSLEALLDQRSEMRNNELR